MTLALPHRLATAALIFLLGGCAATAPSPTAAPSRGGVLGLDWARAEAVQAPAGNGATPAPYENPGSLGHPMAYQGGQADIVDVVANGAGFVAVGYLDTASGPKAAAWASPDGLTWTLLEGFPTSDGSVVRAVAAGEGGLVAVGADGPHAAAWYSADGKAWQRSPSAALAAGPSAELDAVIATAVGYVAGGRNGGLGTEPRAAFWTSPDGVEWTQLTGTPGDAGARVEALAAAPGRLVAVGTAFSGTTISGGAAWTSTDGTAWRRHEATGSPRGPVHAVTAAPSGFLAVGTDVEGRRAIAWSSADGSEWDPAPDAESLDNHGLQIEMRDVARVGERFVAVGHLLFGTQFPSGVIWSSPDGLTWMRAPDAPIFQQAKLFGVTSSGGRAVAVGTFGSPDFAIPTIWISPPR